MDHDLFVWLTRIEYKLDTIAEYLTTTGAKLMQELDDLQAQVTVINSVEDSAIALLNGLAAQLAAAAANPVQVRAIADSLMAKSAELASAVTANTPAG